jgi:Ca-activated chloride channel family protein
LGFNKSTQLLQDWTSNTEAIVDAVPLTRPRGNSAFFDTLRLAIDKVQQGPHAKRVLILITDGADNRSRYSLKEIQEIVKETSVLIYSVNIANEEFSSSEDIEGQRALESISSLSGGRASCLKRSPVLESRDVIALFEIISNELRNQYALTLEVSSPAGGKRWRTVKIATNVAADAPKEMKSLTARARRSLLID